MSLLHVIRNYASKVSIRGPLIRHVATSPVIRVRLSQILRADDGPVKFTKSGAYNLNPLMANQARRERTPWFQGPLVALSALSCLLYFAVLREESDVDYELTGRLYDRVDGLEKADLINSIKFNEEQGIDTRKLKERLREIVELEQKRSN